ncbi:hypothetical protein J2W21_000183 [Sinomonas atrocyanea]|nr:hypothetical protein [Sinomonas atrocyanea]
MPSSPAASAGAGLPAASPSTAAPATLAAEPSSSFTRGARRRRGFTIASVRPSARMFSARTVSRIVMPPKVVGHQPPAKTSCRPSLMTLPHEAAGCCTPAPRKESEASRMIASATMTVANTSTGAAVLRTMCLVRM